MLRDDLIAAVDGEVRFDAGSRAAYAHDSSNYRQPPIGVVVPYSIEAGVAALKVCREHDVPVLSRGGGTSLAGQCCNEAVIIDWSKYCTRLISVDRERRRALVEVGACLDDLNHELKQYGLMVGPKPSTHDTCTIGGMVGNNSCGASAQAYGKMSDSVHRLEVVTYDGARFWVGETDDEEFERIAEETDSTRASGLSRRAEIYTALRRLRDEHMALIRTRYPDIPRRVSGYNLDSLLPEKGFHMARALVGSECTLVTVLHAEIELFPIPNKQSLVVLGYNDVGQAGDAVAEVASHKPLALEGLDNTLIELAKVEHIADEQTVKELPDGAGWLMVRFGGDTQEEADAKAQKLIKSIHKGDHAPATSFTDDPAKEERLWKVREAGLGATAYPPNHPDTHEGWEDAAVPPDRLGDYLRDFQQLIQDFDYGPVSLYGHFGQGCVHTRIPFDLKDPKGVEKYRAFAERAARLVASYGGSLSGEHGDGQSRGELLPIMFGDEVVALFSRVKGIFDPADRMNPGKVVRPYRLDENLDKLTYHPPKVATFFSYPDDHGHFEHAAARCVGIGKCRSSTEVASGVMCPSYRVTAEEEHSTRGRSRVLQEMLRGEIITTGWRSKEVKDALDLCLACKGCRHDCPVNVDMATYKAEFLAHHYAWRPRPLSHYSMGWLPQLAKLASVAPGPINAATHAPGLSRLIKLAGGVDTQRELPRFASQRFIDWFKQRPQPVEPTESRGRVVLWPDTFTNNFHPRAGQAAVRLLEAAGFEVEVPPVALCCGLTWISTGQLNVARRMLKRTVRALAPRLRQGVTVVGLEPSCTAVFRADAPELMPDNADVKLLSEQTKTLSELLVEHDAVPTLPRGYKAIAQPHCHQHSIMGFDPDREALKRAGVEADVLDVGCCGLAGNFGFERGHHEISTAVAEQGVWPAVRKADRHTAILADGFSCRTQIKAGTDAEPIHLAELLAFGGPEEPGRGSE